jgi:hypothetical protein
MANFDFTEGTGAVGASDEIGGVHYPRVKLTWGASGIANDANASTPLPVQTGATIKAASTPPVVGDAAIVVSVSPNSPGVISADASISGISPALTSTSDFPILAAPGAGLRNYITHIMVANAHADVGTLVLVKDGSNTIYAAPAAPAFGGASLTLPVPLRQPQLNTAINVQCSSTGANVVVAVSGYKGA